MLVGGTPEGPVSRAPPERPCRSNSGESVRAGPAGPFCFGGARAKSSNITIPESARPPSHNSMRLKVSPAGGGQDPHVPSRPTPRQNIDLNPRLALNKWRWVPAGPARHRIEIHPPPNAHARPPYSNRIVSQPTAIHSPWIHARQEFPRGIPGPFRRPFHGSLDAGPSTKPAQTKKIGAPCPPPVTKKVPTYG